MLEVANEFVESEVEFGVELWSLAMVCDKSWFAVAESIVAVVVAADVRADGE